MGLRIGGGGWVMSLSMLCLVIGLVTPTPLTAADLSPGERLDEAKTLYYEAEFQRALDLLDPYLAAEGMLPAERIDGLELRAKCLFALGKKIEARKTVEEILNLDGRYRMDPDTVHPGLLEIYFRILDERGELRLPEGIRTVAVLDLTNSSVTEHDRMEPLRQGLADAIITNINQASEVIVVERERLRYIRDEIGLQQSDEFDARSAVRVGRLLGAQSFLFGGFTRIGGKIRIDTRLVKTETGELLKTRSVDGKTDEIFDLIRRLSEETVSDLGAVYEMPLEKTDAEFKAFLEYCEGLSCLDRRDLDTAREHFRTALEYSPDYERAKSRYRELTSLYAMTEQESSETQ